VGKYAGGKAQVVSRGGILRLGRKPMILRSYVLLTLACALAGFANAQFVQQGGKLVAGGAVNWEDGAVGQGVSVALSADGNTAIVGGG